MNGNSILSFYLSGAAISLRASTFYDLINLHSGLVEKGPDGQGGSESSVFQDLVRLIQEDKGAGFS